MSRLAHSDMRLQPGRFSPAETAFALAWEVHAPGLTGWTVVMDTDDDGLDVMLIDPPLAFDSGFSIRRDQAGTVVSWAGGARRTEGVREALLLICPLAPEALATVEALAAAPAVRV